MKKILVIEDWDKFYSELRSYGYKWRDVTEHTAEKYYDGNVSIDTIMNLLKPHELKDVMWFEATVIRMEETLGAGKFINANIPDNLDVKDGDKLHVLAVKKKKLPSFADMKGIFRKKEEPDEQKS